MKSQPKILLLYKNSTYASYFLNSQKRFSQLQSLFNSQDIKRFRQAHDTHFNTLSFVENSLKDKGLKYTKICRGAAINYNDFNLVITIGGDGTFLEAAGHIGKQTIWGVNSDPTWSVGRFCSGNPSNFTLMFERILSRKVHFKVLNRLQLIFNNNLPSKYVLNDVLICHQNPAAMSRYHLKVGQVKEEQRSSGMWISTAAGSSGGIYSAGGKIFPDQSRGIQYVPRELYRGSGIKYKLKGAILNSKQTLSVASLMREGVIFVDGSHVRLPFSFGTTIKIVNSSQPLKVIWS